MEGFKVVSPYKPAGDQPKAIEALVNGFKSGLKQQTLLGVTGSGKTFTVANVVEALNVPTLVLAHNKTLAAQLCSEFREFFPNHAVEYFVSYYDYYQPEAYVAASDTYIEKDSAINEEIDKLRHSATAALFERSDVIIVASVSCIYGLGNPIDYQSMVLSVRPGMVKSRDEIVERLVSMQYVRNDINFTRSTFRVRGDVVEIMPATSFDKAIRIELFGDEIERIVEVNALTGQIIGERNHAIFFPASHYVTPREKLELAIGDVEKELEERIAYFKSKDLLIEAQRIDQRTRYDIEMLREVGFCQGIENYSRVLSMRPAGARPYTLLDYFPKDFLMVIDESHVSVSQVRGMFGGDQSRKKNLVDFGFRLPSAMDNRPLNFGEFESLLGKVLYVSATPSPYEKEHSQLIVEQVIRPTGLLDPVITIRPVAGQIDDLFNEVMLRVGLKERILITTLTKRMAEDLTEYFKGLDVKVRYMHSDVETLERMEIIRDLRLGVFDVLVGINLLREGLDLPEVSLVAIIDADKEGFLRSETALIQTVGRAARHLNGQVIMYADKITNSMRKAIDETNRRREIQNAYNIENGITPESIVKNVHAVIEATRAAEEDADYRAHFNGDLSVGFADGLPQGELLTKASYTEKITDLSQEMMEASNHLAFEKAAALRDQITALKTLWEKTQG